MYLKKCGCYNQLVSSIKKYHKILNSIYNQIIPNNCKERRKVPFAWILRGWRRAAHILKIPSVAAPSGKQNCRHFRKKNRQIGGADQKKHMVVEFFNTSWRILMGSTIGKAYHIVWYFQNWAKLPTLTKKNRQEKSSNWRWRRWRQTLSAKDKCDHQIQIDWLTNLASFSKDQLFEGK